MNIERDIRDCLERNGWTPTELARRAGVAPPTITRILTQERYGLHSKTIERLWPFLYGDKQPESQS